MKDVAVINIIDSSTPGDMPAKGDVPLWGSGPQIGSAQHSSIGSAMSPMPSSNFGDGKKNGATGSRTGVSSAQLGKLQQSSSMLSLDPAALGLAARLQASTSAQEVTRSQPLAGGRKSQQSVLSMPETLVKRGSIAGRPAELLGGTGSVVVDAIEYGIEKMVKRQREGEADGTESNETAGSLRQNAYMQDGMGSPGELEPLPEEPPVGELGKAPKFRLLHIAQKELLALTIGLICICLGMCVELGQPLIYGECMKVILDAGATLDEKMRAINLLMMMLIGFLLFASTLTIIRGQLFALASARSILQIRRKLYQTVLSQETAFFDHMQSSAIAARLMMDPAQMGNLISTGIPGVVAGCIRLTGCVGLMMYTDWQMTCMILLVIPALIILLFPFVKQMTKISIKAMEVVTKVSVTANETLANIRTVRSFAAEKLELAKFWTIIGNPKTKCFMPANDESVFRMNLMRNRLGIIMGELANYVLSASVFAVLWHGFIRVAKGEQDLPSVFVFLQYTYMLFGGLGAVSGAIPMLSQMQGTSLRVFQLMNRQPRMDVGGQGTGMVMEKFVGEITFQNVRFCYPTRPQVEVLQNLSFCVPENTVAAFVGSSGSGKSTVLSLIARFYDANAGRVMVDGMDVRSLDSAWLRLSMAYVQQEPALFAMTIRSNLCYGITARAAITGASDEVAEEDIINAAKQANAHDFIEGLPSKYETLLGERGLTLSGGQKQRVAIARALLLSPKLLLLDEATSALDAESEFVVQEAIDRMMVGRTSIAVAHRLSTVRDADQIFVMSNHRLEAQGKHDELLQTSPTYMELAKRQMAGGGDGGGGNGSSGGRLPRIYEEPVIV
mmetsp:Transcript_36684/g.86004  ORF Transcript_36684/g.86004 Transcript_36684/m.86004 type:complete len:841 (+) Transcript_36684:163-2685(+)|eukprot:CAMPEP_0178413636 /NCGR_PEP_ID=MMETSP0689_2-20121128/22629_1 /TAXON_ID=160604 /ORGANISM="Amphidinium massartii, Strain CS-259" /LENGTH=840 /DNA_ID=CAMNT_0020034913 /DNA_START=56 /DNA_END=2578 /DNA_ORIENTATION=+